MFQLKKILNSSSTVPEFISCETNSTNVYKRGFLLKMNEYGIVNNVKVGEMPTHVCCENLKAGESNRVICFAILDTMVFSAPAIESMQDVAAGIKVVLSARDGTYVDAVSANTLDGYATIHDTCQATQENDLVLIRFVP